ncbi:MAG: flagellar biosynthesis protein FliQ [Oxalobacteraceae bacterium]|jgi:flagellar biosynthetic protein FliQ|nr:flagellar biosynthesis protein FliQ [Oxalobacteraceae bacterium]
MEIATVVDLGRSALWAVMIIASPMLVVALGVGLFIGVIQAATSINEMTLSFIPKLAAMGVTLALFGGWQLSMLVDYTRDIYKRIPALFS